MNINKAIQSAINYQQEGNLQQAETIYKKIIKFQPNNLYVTHQLANILQDKGEIDEAIVWYQKAIKMNPNDFGSYYNLADVFLEKGQLDQAILNYQESIKINPTFPWAYNNLGLALKDLGQLDIAIINFKKAIEFAPDFAPAFSNLGCAFQYKGQLQEALIHYKKALHINPNLTEAYSQLTYLMQQTCNWQEFEVMTSKLDNLTSKALDAGMKPAETPFMSIVRHDNPPLNLAIAKSWSQDITRAMSNLKIGFSFDVRKIDKTRITIGYLSNDFGNHATAHLMLSLFGLHNRDAFRIHCYSYGKDDGSSYRTRIQHDCDKFIDISSLSYDAGAKCIYEDKIDILVDLKGHTRGNRLAICALRPAPIQVTYLGFPGTTGADFVDYIITDKIVTPEDQSLYYTEKFVYMPHCYQVNDHTQTISKKEWKKADFGLPENSFVFCSFNNQYKIDLMLFGVWMKILKQVPESVLWLISESKLVENNLKREAETRGVMSERLIFAEKLPKDEHLARLRLADLSLDTRIVNGHTTTSDALWAGVPVITLQGSHFASRVSSSILSAIGLSDFVTHSLEAFEALAVRLANNPIDIREIRKRVAENRLVEPLFDTPRFVRNLETGYKKMWKIFLAGEAPRQIEVLES